MMYSTEILWTRGARLAILAVAVLLLLFALGLAQPRAALAAPANDNFASAQVITGTSSQTPGTTAGATAEPGEPFINGTDISVWYRWTAPATGTVTLDTCNSDFDTRLEVFTGSFLSSLNHIAEDGDSCPDTSPNPLGSQATFDVMSGVTYQIRINPGVCCSDPGGNFTLGLSEVVAPPNDNFSSAQVIGGSSAVVSGRTTGASAEPGEPFINGTDRSVWYRWTAPFTGRATIDTCNSDFDTRLEVFTGGSLSSLNHIAEDGDSCPDTSPNPLGSQATFDVKAGTIYLIRINPGVCCSELGGNFTLRLKLVDTIKPWVKSLIATNRSSTGVPLRKTNFTATFSEVMNKTTLNKSTFKLFKCVSTTDTACTTQITNVTVVPNSNGLSATLNPYGATTTLLAANTKYKVVVTPGAKDLAGNALDQSSTQTGYQPKVAYFKTGST